MRLKNRDPQEYVGRTIIFCHQAWQVDAINATHILLSKPGLQEKGLLLMHLFDQCRLFPQLDEIRVRYPKLLRALKTVCNLTTLEAENAVFCMITYGQHFMGSEAIAHIGGAGRAVALCWRHRKRVRESFARTAQQAVA